MRDLDDSFHGAQAWLHQHKDLKNNFPCSVLADVKNREHGA
jgi:hypothetical protein